MRDTNGNNCSVMSCTDDSHVKRVTPLELKHKELVEAGYNVEPLERTQEKQVAAIRGKTHARPLGGNE